MQGSRRSTHRPVKGTGPTCGLTVTWRRGGASHRGRLQPRWTPRGSRSSTPRPLSKSSTTDTPDCTGLRGDARPRPVESRAFMRDDRIREPIRVAVLHDHLRFIGGGGRGAVALASPFHAGLYLTDPGPAPASRAGV